jgi:hypothetical protein
LEDRTVPSYTFTTIDVPGSIETDAVGNNDLGNIVGAYRTPDNMVHGFRLSDNIYTTIDPPGSFGTNAAGINNSGEIAGIYGGTPGTRDFGFLLNGETYTSINPPGSTENGANKINSAGDIVGGYSTDGFLIDQRGYLLSGGNFTTIEVAGATDTFASGINDSGQIVGAFGDFHSGVRHGYLLSSGTYTSYDVPGATFTQGLAINNSGQIVGSYESARMHGYLLTGGVFTTIDVPGSTYTEADGINSNGVIVGTFTDSSGVTHGFIATPDNHAPTLDPIPGQSIAEGGTLTLTATASDPDVGQTLTYSLDAAPPGATIDPATGEFTWTAGDGPASATVTVRVTDNGSPALSDTQSFTITVNNVAPTAGVSGPTDGVPGQSLNFMLSATDPSADDQAAEFGYTIDWGDGTITTGSGPSGVQIPHTYTRTGTFTVLVTATDKDGGQSDAATQDVAIQSVVLEGNTLAVGGTLVDDDIVFQSANHDSGVKVLIDGVSQGVFAGAANLLAFGQAGNDNIRVGSAIALPATLVGGDGDDYLVAGAGNTVLLGGAGTDRLQGGPGNDAIDGGAGFLDVLIGGGGNDTLTDPDGVGQVAGGAGNDDITISFAPDWNINGSHSLPGGSITGGAGDDVIRVTANNPAMRFDVSGDGGDDRIELSGTWNRIRVYGGAGTDTLKNLGAGFVVPMGIEVFE